MRAALYLRVSTKDDRQTTENQRRQLLAYAEARGFEVVAEFEDHASGGKGRANRRGFDRMMRAAERREFDVLLFWSLDRLTREGASTTFGYLERLRAAGVAFHAYNQPSLSTSGLPAALQDIVIAVSAAWAQMERETISERTIAGLQRAKAEGRKAGRPSQVDLYRNAVLTLARLNGWSTRRLAAEVGTSQGTVRRILDQAEADAADTVA